MTKTKTRKSAFKRKSLYGIVFTVIIFSFLFIQSLLHSPTNRTADRTFRFRAAIVDQGSLSPAAGPNQDFIEAAANILKQDGFTVDYYPGENVTVEFFRNLPMQDYGLIILRVHSTTGGQPSLALFTSDSYIESRYVLEQMADRVVPVAYTTEDVERRIAYFGITPLFVGQSMIGRFQNTIIIMMGCEGLNNTTMAKAFVEKGAKVYISWNQGVSAFHTDAATTDLLQHFLIEKLTLKKSVLETFKTVGFDPIFKSLLIYYPVDIGEQTIENIAGAR